MRYLTLSSLLTLRLENVDNIIHILGGQYHLENTGNGVHTLRVCGTALLPYNYAEETYLNIASDSYIYLASLMYDFVVEYLIFVDLTSLGIHSVTIWM